MLVLLVSFGFEGCLLSVSVRLGVLCVVGWVEVIYLGYAVSFVYGMLIVFIDPLNTPYQQISSGRATPQSLTYGGGLLQENRATLDTLPTTRPDPQVLAHRGEGEVGGTNCNVVITTQIYQDLSFPSATRQQ